MRSTDDTLLMVLDKNVVVTLGLDIKMTYFQFSKVAVVGIMSLRNQCF